MGIFDKVSGLFKSKEDKKEKELSEIEVEKIIQKLESELEPESEPEPALELSSEPVI